MPLGEGLSLIRHGRQRNRCPDGDGHRSGIHRDVGPGFTVRGIGPAGLQGAAFPGLEGQVGGGLRPHRCDGEGLGDLGDGELAGGGVVLVFPFGQSVHGPAGDPVAADGQGVEVSAVPFGDLGGIGGLAIFPGEFVDDAIGDAAADDGAVIAVVVGDGEFGQHAGGSGKGDFIGGGFRGAGALGHDLVGVSSVGLQPLVSVGEGALGFRKLVAAGGHIFQGDPGGVRVGGLFAQQLVVAGGVGGAGGFGHVPGHGHFMGRGGFCLSVLRLFRQGLEAAVLDGVGEDGEGIIAVLALFVQFPGRSLVDEHLGGKGVLAYIFFIDGLDLGLIGLTGGLAVAAEDLAPQLEALLRLDLEDEPAFTGKGEADGKGLFPCFGGGHLGGVEDALAGGAVVQRQQVRGLVDIRAVGRVFIGVRLSRGMGEVFVHVGHLRELGISGLTLVLGVIVLHKGVVFFLVGVVQIVAQHGLDAGSRVDGLGGLPVHVRVREFLVILQGTVIVVINIRGHSRHAHTVLPRLGGVGKGEFFDGGGLVGVGGGGVLADLHGSASQGADADAHGF